jgi:hypothetical protein
VEIRRTETTVRLDEEVIDGIFGDNRARLMRILASKAEVARARENPEAEATFVNDVRRMAQDWLDRQKSADTSPALQSSESQLPPKASPSATPS